LEQPTNPVSHRPGELTLYDRACLGCDRCELGTDRRERLNQETGRQRHNSATDASRDRRLERRYRMRRVTMKLFRGDGVPGSSGSGTIRVYALTQHFVDGQDPSHRIYLALGKTWGIADFGCRTIRPVRYKRSGDVVETAKHQLSHIEQPEPEPRDEHTVNHRGEQDVLVDHRGWAFERTRQNTEQARTPADQYL
jgi:hypothetical protein